MRSLVACVLEQLQRGEPPASELLAQLGDGQPELASAALLRTASFPELSSTRSSWVPALLLSGRPGRGARRLCELTERAREELGAALDVSAMPSLALLLGSSEFLGRTLVEHPHWARDLDGDPPPPPRPSVPERDWDAIAEAKYRGLLRVAARELLGCPLHESQTELSAVAERCLRAALDCSCRELGVGAPGMLALGRLGSREFGLAPEVELLFLDSDSSSKGDPERAVDAARLVQHLLTELGRERAGGHLYRAGRGLRAILGPAEEIPSVAEAVRRLAECDGLLHRHQLLRARPIAGPEDVGHAFVSALPRLVYAVRDTAGRRALVEPVAERPSDDGLAWSVRDAPGGIRDLECLVHDLVLRHGAEKPAVRTGNVAGGLSALAQSGVIDEDCASTLSDCLGWLRRAEHFLQLENEESTWDFPRDEEGQYALARCMGYREPDASRARSRLLEDWRAVREEVRLRGEELRFAGGVGDRSRR